ncbi:D-alanyl-D-alanine carboxypeptidase family protein [Streptomyces sp. WAC07149]|uniref:D-alanyl-D-alanine carboxypeptidase family protein n=1 Tax=Streptomyces sp. WAC07149 TaxID=2487425 RepID=UPI0021AF3069|nr:hypothetical protein [Streptomyces sp. WAC07149]
MAGESPDKSVDEGASGEQDPRLSVFQPRDPLKEAVAAWVAAEEPGERTEDADAESGSAPSRPSPGRVDPKTPAGGVVRQSAPRDAEKPGSASADSEAPSAKPGEKPGTAPAKPSEGAEEPAAKPSGDVRTTAFGVARTGSAPETEKPGTASAKPAAKPSGDADEPAVKPSGDVRTTAFGVVRADSAPETEKPDSASAKPAAKPSGDADEPAVKPSGDVRTTAFGVVRTGSAPETEKPDSASAKPAAKPSGDVRTTAFGVVTTDPAPESEKPARDPRTGAADSERTAVFRAVKPGSASADADKPTAKDPAPESEKPARDPRTAPADGERTAVFRTVKPGSGSGSAPEKPSADTDKADKANKAEEPAAEDAKKPATPAADSDSERTAVFRAVKPGSASAAAEKPAEKPAAEDAKKPAAPAADSDSERTAVFRAVKPGSASPDAEKGKPAAAKADAPKPDTDRPGAAGTGAPGKPAPQPRAGGGGKGESDRRVSTFVPLRGEGEGAPAAKPPVRPAPPARPSLDPSERTTQQPLPPRPPLDMLADLTNNPPPPPTPMRNAVRRVKIYAPLVLLLIIVIAVVQAVRPLPAPKLKLTAKATYTFPGGAPNLPWPTEGQASMAAAGLGTIGSSGEQKPVPIASVTKSMTAYIIMRDHPFKKGEKGAMIDVDKTAETEGQKDKSDNESTLNTVKEGEKISEYDAIAALMIPSANNIARLLARWDSGSQEAFVKKMNDTAKELGMTNTTYTDPSGLDATTVSTAEDQVKLGLKIVEIPALVDITRMPAWTDQTGKVWQNWNRLVPFNDSLGIKTGTTTKAGGNLLFAAQKKVGDTNQLLVGAVLGQHKPPIIDTVIAQSRSLLIATQKEVQGAPVVKKGQVVGYVDDGLGGHTPVVATADVQAVGWSSLTVDIKLGDGGTAIPESAKAGTQVGVLTVGDGASQVKVPVALQRALETPGFGSKLTRIG